MEDCSWGLNYIASYSGGPRLDCRPEDQLSLLRFIEVLICFSRQLLEHNVRFHPYYSRFLIHDPEFITKEVDKSILK